MDLFWKVDFLFFLLFFLDEAQMSFIWSSGQLTLRRPGSSWGFGALLKGLTSVNIYWTIPAVDSNPQPRITSSTLYPLGHDCPCEVALQRLYRRRRYTNNLELNNKYVFHSNKVKEVSCKILH